MCLFFLCAMLKKGCNFFHLCYYKTVVFFVDIVNLM